MKIIKNILKYIKAIFLIGVVFLVIFELSKLRREFSYDELSNIFTSIGFFKLTFLMVLGFLSFIPMINYDLILNRFANCEKSIKYTIKRSIIINSFNNLIGFGGLINMGLRFRYFAKENDDKKLLKFLAKSFLFDLTGISFLSLITLISLIIYKSTIIINYKYWLIGGILYGPLILIVSLYKNTDEFHISKKYSLDVSLTSIVEWTSAMLFFISIAYVLNLKIKFFPVAAIFVVANLIGLISFIPGGLGSFDLAIITILSSIGINTNEVFTWLILYRLFYYIVPFIIGILFFISDLGESFDLKNDKIPSKIVKSIGLDLLCLILYILGALMVTSISVPDNLSKIRLFKGFNLLNANLIYQFLSLLLGFSFILLGRANRKRVKSAVKATIIYLLIALFYCILSGFSFIEISLIIISLILITFTREIHFRKQFVYSMENITLDSIVYFAIGTLTVILSVINYGIKIKRTRYFILIPFEKSFVNIIIITGIVYFATRILMDYLKGNKEKLGEKLNRQTVLEILNKYDCYAESALALVGDKDIYYYENENGEKTCAMSICTYRDRVLVMGDAFGKKEDFKKLIENFVTDADKLCYNPVFYEIKENQTIYLHDFGYSFIKFGEKAKVKLSDFVMEGPKRKSQRNVIKKFEKKGLSFEIVSPPYQDDFMEELKKISDSWLDGRIEKGFSLGFFNEDYLKLCPMALVKDGEKILAFSNIMPTSGETWATIDLMRYDRENEQNGIMDFLFINLILYFKDLGKKYFDFGMAPLYNVGINSNSFIEEKLAYLVYKFGYKFYSFDGLRAYKEKFNPEWSSVYLSYTKNTWLLYSVITIFLIDIKAKENYDKNRK